MRLSHFLRTELAHLFLPHPETHKKAPLISIQALIIYVAIFMVLQMGLSVFSKINPDILGINSTANIQEIIALTNKERSKQGLSTLVENPKLDQAAYAKAQNMYEENYWAHYSPSGKDPWGFFQKAGYKFSYAGENLARNFYTSEDVVAAWMASPTHRGNLLNPHYQEIGISIVEGNLEGQSTLLIVQEFGKPVGSVASVPKAPEPKLAAVTSQVTDQEEQAAPLESSEDTLAKELPVKNTPTTLTAGVTESISDKNKIDPFKIMKYFGVGLLGFILALLVIDLYIIRRRAIHRVASRHLPHLAFISVSMGALLNLSPGKIL